MRPSNAGAPLHVVVGRNTAAAALMAACY